MSRLALTLRVVALLGAALLVTACERVASPTAASTSRGATGTRFLGESAPAGFARATAPREFRFPEDHGPHPDFRTEWWYFTGNLRDTRSRRYGFELTFFRIALDSGPVERTSAWGTKQIWMAHFAVTDAAGRRFVATERLARDALGLAGATASPFRVWVKDWAAEGTADAAQTDVRLAAAEGGTAIDLRLESTSAPVAQGNRGLDAKGPEAGNASYYYSMPRLAASGSVTLEGMPLEVEGLVWMDREWSTSALSAGVAGWDWFALHLNDGRDLMFYRLRRDDGSASEFSGGSLVDGSGESTRLRAGDVELTPLEWWTSSTTSVRYPIRWRMRVPSAGLDLEVEPYIPNQELTVSVRYWEGAVRASSSDGRADGEGYLELAGY